jgi:hypothetical protein
MKRKEGNMELAFRLIHWQHFQLPGTFQCVLIGVGKINPKYPTEFLAGRSLFELAHYEWSGWYMDILFIHVLTFSKLFWGVF